MRSFFNVLVQNSADSRTSFVILMWVCLKIGYIPNYSHLIGIMISKTIGCRGTNHFQTNPCGHRKLPPLLLKVNDLLRKIGPQSRSFRREVLQRICGPFVRSEARIWLSRKIQKEKRNLLGGKFLPILSNSRSSYHLALSKKRVTPQSDGLWTPRFLSKLSSMGCWSSIFRINTHTHT